MDVVDLSRLLPIARNRLDEELELQAAFHYHVHQVCAQLAFERDKARAQRDKVKATCAAAIDAAADGKVSETKLERMVAEVPAYINAREAFYAAERAAAEAEGLKEAWKQRSHALTALSNLYSSEYYTRESTYEQTSPQRQRYSELVNEPPQKRRRASPQEDAAQSSRKRLTADG